MKISEHLQKHGVVHLWWTIGVLIAVVLGLLSMKLGTDDSIKDVLNFALALASLMLAMVAIVQALIAGGDLSRTMSGVTAAVAEIRQPAQQLAEAAFVIGNYSENIGLHALEIREGTSRLLARTETVPESSVSDNPSYSAAEMLPQLSPMAALALYLCLRSFETGRPIPSYAFKEMPTTFWVWGYINALSNLSLIGIERDEQHAFVRDLGPFAWVANYRSQLQGNAVLIADVPPAKYFADIDALFAGPEAPAPGT